MVALLTGLVSRATELKEDAALATFYLLSLALGVTIVSLKGTNIDLLHVLFGNVLALDDQTLLLIAANATITLVVLALIYRPLVIECVDPGFMRSVSRAGAPAHLAFLALVVVNLVSGFHALGTLLAVGIMMLPAAIARFWARDITTMIVIATVSGMVSGALGLLLSYHTGVASGPAIILVAGAFYVASLLFGRVGGLVRQAFPGATWKLENVRSYGEHHVEQATGAHRIHNGRHWLHSPLSPRGRRPRSRSLPASRFSATWCGMSAAIASRSTRWSGRTATPMSTRPPRPMPARSPTPRRCSSTPWASKAGSTAWSRPRAPRRRSSSRRKASRCASAAAVMLTITAGADPHAWQSVANAKIYVDNIRDGLIAIDPDGKADLRGKCRRLSQQARRARARGQGHRRQDSGRAAVRHHQP